MLFLILTHHSLFSPAKFIDHGSNREWTNHSPDTEDGHGKTPHHSVGSRTEGLPVPLQRHIVEKPT